jgi:hypothetical protein
MEEILDITRFSTAGGRSPPTADRETSTFSIGAASAEKGRRKEETSRRNPARIICFFSKEENIVLLLKIRTGYRS